MRKLLMSLSVLAGVSGLGAVAQAAPHGVAPAVPHAVPQAQTVQYHEGWRQREWRRREHERHRRHEEWRRHHRGGYHR